MKHAPRPTGGIDGTNFRFQGSRIRLDVASWKPARPGGHAPEVAIRPTNNPSRRTGASTRRRRRHLSRIAETGATPEAPRPSLQAGVSILRAGRGINHQAVLRRRKLIAGDQLDPVAV